ncbi:MAG: SAM-dependent methyltransferase [Saprospiraceae bacterium]|jgi:SAM-dependent methyltransferase
MDLKELESGVDPSTNWYYQSKKVPLFKYFKQLVKDQGKKITVIDFGSGSGFFAYELFEAFPEHIEDVLLIDIGYSEEEMAATKNEPVKKLRYIPHGINDSIVVMMDVLEHIEDDYAILEDIKTRLGENAHFFITVPAFMSVWSSHDVYLGHYRRYTIPMVKKLLTGTKCKIDQQYYIYGSIFPLVWLVRRLKKNEENMTNPDSSDMKPLPGPINFILKKYNSFEMNFRKLNTFFGLTCVAEGRLK